MLCLHACECKKWTHTSALNAPRHFSFITRKAHRKSSTLTFHSPWPPASLLPSFCGFPCPRERLHATTVSHTHPFCLMPGIENMYRHLNRAAAPLHLSSSGQNFFPLSCFLCGRGFWWGARPSPVRVLQAGSPSHPNPRLMQDARAANEGHVYVCRWFRNCVCCVGIFCHAGSGPWKD